MSSAISSPVSVDFHGTTIPTFSVAGIVRVAMRPICEGIGLGWQSQYNRIKRHPVLSKGVFMMNTPSKGGIQRVLTLPLSKLNGWLFGIDTSRVKPEIRERLEEYQAECFEVLAAYWQQGEAVNPRMTTVDERRPLNRAVRTLANLRSVRGDAADYAGMWRLVNGYLGVEHIDEATEAQVERAMAFVQEQIEQESRKIIEGEWQARPACTPLSRSQQVQLLNQINRAHHCCYLREASAVSAVRNRLKVHFHLREVSDLPAERFDEAMAMLEEQYRASVTLQSAVRALCDAFIRDVLGGGEPWTPWIKRQLGGTVLEPRPDWRRLARQLSAH